MMLPSWAVSFHPRAEAGAAQAPAQGAARLPAEREGDEADEDERGLPHVVGPSTISSAAALEALHVARGALGTAREAPEATPGASPRSRAGAERREPHPARNGREPSGGRLGACRNRPPLCGCLPYHARCRGQDSGLQRLVKRHRRATVGPAELASGKSTCESPRPAGDRAARRVGTHAGLRARGAAAARAPPRRTWPWRSPSPGAAS